MNSNTVTDLLLPREDGRTATTVTTQTADDARDAVYQQHIQEILGQFRAEFTRLSKVPAGDTNRLKTLYERLLSAPFHIVDLDENFKNWVYAVDTHPNQSHRKYRILVSGWYSPQEADSNSMTAPAIDLLSALYDHSVYHETVTLRNKWVSRDENPKEWDAFWNWFNQFPNYFSAPADDGCNNANDIVAQCAEKMPTIRSEVEWHLLQLQCKALLFAPSATNPEQGWIDFLAFIYHYHRLDEEFRQRFGPCTVIFQAPNQPPTNPAVKSDVKPVVKADVSPDAKPVVKPDVK